MEVSWAVGATWPPSGALSRASWDHQSPSVCRHSKGFGDGPVKMPDLRRKNLRFHRVGLHTFVCEDTGWVHTCDHDGCREAVIDSEGVITCPITGRTSQRLVSHHEERVLQRSADAAFACADQELLSFSAAQAFTEGRCWGRAHCLRASDISSLICRLLLE